ncbi:MAG: glycosyltransferase family 4 protein [bacterium]|nr:glycosyltransferase family 4 protein [bacterium]
MRIVFLSDDFPPQSFGGAGIVAYDFAIAMKRMGHEIYVITTCRNRDEAGVSEYHGIKVWKITSNYSTRWRSYLGLYNPPVVRQVAKLLKNIKPDVVHAHNIHFYLSYHTLVIAKRFSKVVVLTAHDVMSFNYGKLHTKRYLENFDAHTTWFDHLKQARKRWNPLRNLFIRKYLKHADKIFAVSGALKKALEQNGIVNVEVMYFGADVNLWRTSGEEVAQFREKYNLTNKKVILFGGRLSEAKGGGKALEVMAELEKEVDNVVLLVAGKMEGYAASMKEAADKLGIGGRLIFTGWIERDEIKSAYACADLVLVPSIIFDSFPRIVLEAMACAKPVVGTCYGGAPEIIEDGITGYVVNPFHTKEVAEKMLDLINHPEKAERFGKAGLDRIKTNFNLNVQIAKLIAIYETLY